MKAHDLSPKVLTAAVGLCRSLKQYDDLPPEESALAAAVVVSGIAELTGKRGDRAHAAEIREAAVEIIRRPSR